MDSTGFIVIQRKLLDWQWWDNTNGLGLWIHILVDANWKDGWFMGDRIPRGSFATSIKHLSEETDPVRHGKWIPCAKRGLILTEQMRKEGIRWYGFKCSACNFVRKGNAPREANYCECCGARMDAERKEE